MAKPFNLNDSVLHLVGAGAISRASNEPSFWDRTNRPELRTGQVVSVFSYGTAWDYEERHPDGDELAVVLNGNIEFLLDTGSGATPVRLGQGSACIVPAGAWHRVAVREPSTVLFITPVPARTERRPIGADTHEQRRRRASASGT